MEFFAFLRERGGAGVIAAAFPALIFGSIVVAFHNVRSGIPLVLTVVGWAHVAKASVYFAFPSFALRRLHLPSRRGPARSSPPASAPCSSPHSWATTSGGRHDPPPPPAAW